MDPINQPVTNDPVQPPSPVPSSRDFRAELTVELWNLLKGRSSGGVGKLWQVARENPLPAAVVGLGLGLLVAESARKSEARAALLASAREKVIGAADSAREAVGEAADWTREQATDLGQQIADKASDLGHQVADKASDLGHQATLQARRARLGFWQAMEENPLKIGAGVLALGVLIGLAIPSTDPEDELMGETRDRLLDNVREAGRQALDPNPYVA
ncbi:MAG TPA: hypothetical protein VIE43_02715 [Thermoanaerobaculia bacterium]|jgi:hypothetical protein|nr:hypothetical protein [Thermoanaerobaculia bacterium]